MSGKDGGGHHGLERAFGLVLGAILVFSWGVAAVQAAVAMVTPIVRAATAWLEGHAVLLGVGAIVVIVMYTWLRIRFRPRRSPRGWPGEQPPVYTFDGRVDRAGLIGSLGRWMASRSGGPVVVRGQPIHVHRAEAEDLEDDQDGEDEPEEVDEQAERRYTTRQARDVYSRIIRER